MFKQVLLPVDLNHESSWVKALPAAIMCCKACDAPLHVVMVMPDFHMPMVAEYFPADFEDKARAATERALETFVKERVPTDVRVTHHALSGGHVSARILEAAADVGADLIVMSAYRPDLKDFLLGSNASKVVHHARQTVMVVRE